MAAHTRSVQRTTQTSIPLFRQHVSKMIERLIQPEILPYYILIIIYMTVYSPSLPRPHEAVGSAILKILPIWYLIVYVKLCQKEDRKVRASGVNGHISDQTEPQGVSNNQIVLQEASKARLRSYLSGSVPCLIVSSIGDVCLVYNGLFLPGIFFFGIAQLLYLFAMKKLHKSSSKAWVAVPLCCLLYSVLLFGINDSIFKIVVLVYAILIHSMLFFAISSYESSPCPSTLCNMLGASIFVISDLLIACNKWLLPTPHSEFTILSTYYVAQLLLTVGSC